MEPLRCLIDSMIFDAIAAERETLVLVDRLTNARRLQLLAAEPSMRQLAAVPDEEHRRRLQRVRVLVVPPPEPGVLLDELRAARGVDEDDAAIGTAAVRQGVPLVTEDRALRVAAEPHVAVWSWAGELEPRLRALAAAGVRR